jgi:hypothetical protein
MVAVSTDSTKRVFVWDVARRAVVGGTHLRRHPLPCLALRWSPYDPALLMYAEHRARVHLQVRRAIQGLGFLPFPPNE